MAYQCVNCDTFCENRKSVHRPNRHFAISSRLQDKVREKDKMKPNISIIEGIEELFEAEITKSQLERFAGCYLCKECHRMLRLAVNTKSEVEQCMSSLHERIDVITSKTRRQYYREHYATHKAGKCWGCMFDFSEVFYTSRCVRFRMSAILFEEMTVEEGIKTLLEEEADALHGLFSKNTYLCKTCFQLMRQIVKLQCYYETLHASFSSKTADNSIIALLLRGEMPSVVSSVFSVKGISTAGNSQASKGTSSAQSSHTSKGVSSAASSQTSKGVSNAVNSQTNKKKNNVKNSGSHMGVESSSNEGMANTVKSQNDKDKESVVNSQANTEISNGVNTIITEELGKEKPLNNVVKCKEVMDKANVVDNEMCKDSNSSVRTLRGKKRKSTISKAKEDKPTTAKGRRTRGDARVGLHTDNTLENDGEDWREKYQESNEESNENCNNTVDVSDDIGNVVLECDMFDEDEFNDDNNDADKAVDEAEVASKNLKVITSRGNAPDKNTCAQNVDKSQHTRFDVMDNPNTVATSHGKSDVKTVKLNSDETQIVTHLENYVNERNMSAEDWVIYYYPGLAGRAEFIRLVFEEVGVPYKECGESHLRIKQLINQGGMEGYPHFAPPMLKKGDLQVSQTPVICRFLGEELGIGPESKMDKLHAEQINVSCHDYIAEGRLAFHGIEPVGPYLSQKEATQPYIDRFVKDRLPLWMKYFERVLNFNNNGTGFLYGTTISYADLALFHVIQATEAQFPEAYQSADYMPLLKAFSQRIASRTRIAAYLKSDRRNAFCGDSMM